MPSLIRRLISSSSVVWRDQSPRLQFLEHIHFDFFLSGHDALSKNPAAKHKKALCSFMQRAENPRYHLSSPLPCENGLNGVKQRRRALTGAPGSPTPPERRFSSQLRNVFPHPRALPSTNRQFSAPRSYGYFFPSSLMLWIKTYFFPFVKGYTPPDGISSLSPTAFQAIELASYH